MVEVTNNIKTRFADAFEKARAERFTAKRLSPTLYYCRRLAAGHGEYLIRFHEIATIDGEGQVKVECRDLEGEKCKGFWRGGLCAHAAFVILRGIQYGSRKQKQQEAA